MTRRAAVDPQTLQGELEVLLTVQAEAHRIQDDVAEKQARSLCLGQSRCCLVIQRHAVSLHLQR
jgi:hypothetical protein